MSEELMRVGESDEAQFSRENLKIEYFGLNYAERWLLQSALSERIIADHRTSINANMSKEGSDTFAAGRDEKFNLYKKIGGMGSLEDLVDIANKARNATEAFEQELKDKYRGRRDN